MSHYLLVAACLFTICCLPLGATPAAAAEKNSLMQDVIYLDPVVVTGTADEENLNQSSLRVEEKSRSNNIADFLSNDTDISYKRKSNFGDSGDVISIRGFESKRIMLNLDGRSVSSTGNVGGNYIDFNTIPMDNIERIEIVKGGSSIEYGNNALGGVINAYTARPTEEARVTLYGTTGGWSHLHDFHNLRGSYAQQFGMLGVSLGVSHQQAEAFLRNNDYESFHVAPKVYMDTAWKGQFVAGYDYSVSDRGLIRSNRADGEPRSDTDPSLAGFDTALDDAYPVASGEYFAGGAPTPSMNVIGDGAHWVKTRQLMDLTYHQPLGEDAYLELMGFKNHETRREKNYADVAARSQLPAWGFVAALTNDGDLVLDRDVTVDKSYGAKLKGGWDIGDHSLLAGVEYKLLQSGGIKVKYVDTNYNKHPSNAMTGVMASSEGSPNAYVTGAFLGDKYAVTDDLLLDFGVRFDSFEYKPQGLEDDLHHTHISPKVTLTYDLAEMQTVSLALYENYRTPTLPELYWNSQAAPASSAGNVSYLTGMYLKPELERGVDLVYRYRFENSGFAQIAGFYYSIDDYILHKSVPNGASSSWAAYNADATIYGATFTSRWPLLDELALQLAATWQKTKKSDDPADPDNILESLDYIPSIKANLGLTWDIRNDLVLDTTLNYTGSRDYTISTSTLQKGTLGAYSTLGASLRYTLDEHSTLELYGDNLTNTDYEESWGYPAMGTNLGVSLKWKM
ncbi:MAG: TonB-dependent receptor plug domain-containing protein [Desulfovibrio sp.]